MAQVAEATRRHSSHGTMYDVPAQMSVPHEYGNWLHSTSQSLLDWLNLDITRTYGVRIPLRTQKLLI